jgi:YbbR domain-containing protein
MMRLLRRIFLQHAGLKISALVIAMALWVAYNSEPVVETGYSAPLLLVNVPSDLRVTGEVPSAVLLRLRGRLGRLRRVDPSELSVTADCSQARAGTQMVRLEPNLVNIPYDADVVGITPSQIEISLVSASAPPPGSN